MVKVLFNLRRERTDGHVTGDFRKNPSTDMDTMIVISRSNYALDQTIDIGNYNTGYACERRGPLNSP